MAVRLEKEGNVGVIVLDRPPANGYDHAFLREFASAIDDARLDGDVRNVVVTSSSEKFFCAGADCLGGGFELALACDMRFAAEGSYQIGLPEVNLGLFPGSGGTQRLPRRIGLAKAIDFIANATTLKPAEAKEAGLVDRLFPDAAACRAGAIEYLAKLGDGPSVAIGHAKLAATLGYGGPIDLGLALEREAIGRVFVSDDAEEGIKAFTEKRKPSFKGH